MGMVLLQTAVLTIAFVAIVAWPQILAYATLKLGLSVVLSALASVLHWLILFAVIYSSFAIVFLFGPDGKKKSPRTAPPRNCRQRNRLTFVHRFLFFSKKISAALLQVIVLHPLPRFAPLCSSVAKE